MIFRKIQDCEQSPPVLAREAFNWDEYFAVAATRVIGTRETSEAAERREISSYSSHKPLIDPTPDVLVLRGGDRIWWIMATLPAHRVNVMTGRSAQRRAQYACVFQLVRANTCRQAESSWTAVSPNEILIGVLVKFPRVCEEEFHLHNLNNSGMCGGGVIRCNTTETAKTIKGFSVYGRIISIVLAA